MARHPDSPPLLKPGLHPMTLDEVRVRSVDAFPLSTTRARIFRELAELIELIRQAKFTGKLWLDGSFLTDKIDPKDADMVLWLPPLANIALTVEQQDLLDFIEKNAGKPLIDSYVSYDFPQGHALYTVGQQAVEYWSAQFGKSRQGDPKGIAVIEISP